ncbi:MAG: hypothetical protein AMS19_06290 [Gemmatimonas sp. SG8_23]|nr:MAG: hypothetical protein AMS19_06290 [Gemmatimonas sp. SG8_23]
MPAVSVIVPLYNKRSTIARTLRSVYEQTFRDFEVIVVDDGSTDDSRAIVEALDYPDLRLVSQENAGPGAARNHGARISEAEFLAFIDSDDEWLPQYLKRSVEILEADPRLCSVTSSYLEDPEGRDLTAYWHSQGLRDGLVGVEGVPDTRKVLTLLRFMQTITTTLRRERYLHFGGYYDSFRSLYGEDSHLFLKLLLNGCVGLNLEPLARYHREDSDLSVSSRGPRQVESFLIDPDDVRDACPAHLSDVLDRVFEARANKTACVLGYWGDWRRASEVRRRFARGTLGSPMHVPALVAATPIGAAAGAATRLIRRAVR